MRSSNQQFRLLSWATALLALLSFACRLGTLTPAPTLPPPTDTPTTSACPETLDEETLERLVPSMSPTLEMQPGETHDFSLGVIDCCYVFVPVETCVDWSVGPSQGASIDPESGLLTVDPGVPNGSVFLVSADVEDGRHIVTRAVHVFTPQDNPLVGIWREDLQVACDTEAEVTPELPIGELRFWADGTFDVTWTPFEVYVDYWGTYQYSLAQGTFDLAVTGGNYVPDNVDGDGLFFFDEQRRLILDDVWLGSSREETESANCGHRFVR